MAEHREKSGASRRRKDRRDEHRRMGHRRHDNTVVVETEKRKTLDQRRGYQRISIRRSGQERRN